MRTSILIILFTLVFEPMRVAYATPTMRPLPDGVTRENPEVIVLRDHAEARSFTIIPKTLKLDENSLQTFGKQDDSCDSVAEYHLTRKAVSRARRHHAEVSEKRTEILKQVVERLGVLFDEQTKATVERKRAQEKLEEAQTAGNAEEAKKWNDKLDTVDRFLGVITGQIEQLENLQKNAEKEQTDVLKQVELLEKQAEAFAEKMVRPAARMTLKLSIPLPDLVQENFRKGLGLKQDDVLSLPSIVGLSLYPSTQEQGILESIKIAETIGRFDPEWNVSMFEPSGATLATDFSPEDLEHRELPPELAMEQIIPLLTYCAIKDAKVGAGVPMVPVRVSFSVLLFSDDRVLRPTAVPKPPIISFTRQLEESIWTVLASLPGMEKPVVKKATDPGLPSLFTGKGKFEVKQFSVRFK